MLNQGTIMATIAVKDIAAGKAFYSTIIGLRQISETPGGVTFASGNGELFIYQSSAAGTNQATSATWRASDIKAVTEDLRSKGVSFEHYDMSGASWDGDICNYGEWQTAWFKDPDGNILAISQG